MVPSGPAGNRPTQNEEVTEPKELSGPKRLASSLSNITSRLSTATGGWGKWLLNSASDIVAEIGAESEEAKNDLKEFCQTIVSDSTAWIRRHTGSCPTDESSVQPPPNDANSSRTGDDGSHSSSATDSSTNTVTSRHNDEHSSSSSCSGTPSLDDTITHAGRTATSPPSPLHSSSAQTDHSAESPPKEVNLFILEKTKEPSLPIWMTDPAFKRRFRCIATSDESFTSDPLPAFPSSSANNTQQHQQKQQEPACEEPTCGSAVCATDGNDDAGPSEAEIKEYMKDPYVAAARQRLVPEKVTEELFWRRFHARVRHMVEQEEQLSVHLSKLKTPTKAVDDSESEEDISWEDLGDD
ncbi:uncharacterized protein EMH_0035020 [Eimeria mitis]|uniref:BSD domain-containing protein n=1 Tax=Eimeria mitis TaxID=44415 RepID=U6K4A1_9EIME|nr:uncharacterized protein EMH_0035020 [Eimeria mitis]CDJ31162.1 hypothetical protein, conserved [Eimeria mitis]